MNNTHRYELTETEKAFVTYLYFHNIKDWKPYYKLMYPDSKAENITVAVSHFRRSEKVQTYIKALEGIDKIRRPSGAQTDGTKQSEIREREKGKEDKKTGKVFSDGKRDFTDLSSFLSYCNEQANNTTNEKDRQQYLKFISDLLSFKNSGNEQKTDIQRFYSPLQCSGCPLYQKEGK